MTASTSSTELRAAASRMVWPATVVLFGVVPAIAILLLFNEAIADDAVAFDFRAFYAAAEAVLRGGDLNPGLDDSLDAAASPYVYPPLPALLTIPLTPLPFDVAGVIVMAGLVAAVPATLWIVGVRDWRCYGLVLVWPPVISAIQTGNVTLWFALASAVAWRYRDRAVPVATAIGVTLAAKFFLWPLVVWLAVTRRLQTAVLSLAVGAGLFLLSWAVIGFDGMSAYPDLLRRLEDTVGADSYTAYIVGLDVGLPSPVARALWLGLGLAVIASLVVFARRGDERRSFVLAIAAALALTPIVWLHYFALLVVVVAVAAPGLAPVWFVPLAMVVTPGSGQPSPRETLATLLIASLTVAMALRASSLRGEPDLADVQTVLRRRSVQAS
jgi:Glycosyltransferase family 87